MAGSGLLANPAEATTGTMQFGTSNDAGTATTTLTSSATSLTLDVENTAGGDGATVHASSGTGLNASTAATGQFAVGVLAQGGGNGIRGVGSNFYGGSFSGELAPLKLDPAGFSGAPTGGAHLRGELFVDSAGALFCCTADGTPGAWVNLSTGSNLVTLPAPHRVYDSRIGQPNQSPNMQGPLTFTNPSPSAAQRTIKCNKDASTGTVVIPSGATALLLNLTVITISGVGALAVFPTGATQPNASSINWSAGGQVLANGLTSACNSNQQVDVAIVASTGASTDFILDAIGYYP